MVPTVLAHLLVLILVSVSWAVRSVQTASELKYVCVQQAGTSYLVPVTSKAHLGLHNVQIIVHFDLLVGLLYGKTRV